MVYTYQDFEESARFLLQQTPLRPRVGIILGSGLGRITEELTEVTAIDYSDILHFPRVKDPYHQCRLYLGCLDGVPVAAMSGRYHYYEGYSQQTLTLPVRVLAAMGVKQLVLTNAAGGVNTSFSQGCLMLISDHINYTGQSPLIGPNLDAFGPRFPDVSDLYTAELRTKIKAAAAAAGIPLEEGVYMMFTGPNYETPAEVRMARIVGADAVGMSTVPEALVAGHCGMQVVGVSCITNMAAGVLPGKLDHSEVVETANRVHATFQSLLETILRVI